MRDRKHDPEKIRSALEIAEHAALVKQQHREEQCKKLRDETKIIPSVLPPMDNISLDILAKFDTILRKKGTPDSVRKWFLERAEHGLLLKQRNREKGGRASVGDSFEL
jgi:hypothetical protein